MEADIAKAINYILDFINSTPVHLWFTIGVVVASLPVTAVIVEWYKRHHFKVNATELTNHGIDFVVIVTATLMSLADFLIANGTNLSHLFPFLVVAMPTIKAFAPSVYSYSKAIHGWFVNRKSEDQAQRFKAVQDSLDKLSPTLPNYRPLSNGTEANAVTVEKPDASQNLIQL